MTSTLEPEVERQGKDAMLGTKQKPSNPYSVAIDGYLEEILFAIEQFEHADHQAKLNFAKDMCQLSREILYTLNPIAEYERGFIRQVASVLVRSWKVIPEVSEDIWFAKYRAKIKERADELQSQIG
jgi:hypothetical protein